MLVDKKTSEYFQTLKKNNISNTINTDLYNNNNNDNYTIYVERKFVDYRKGIKL